MVFCVAEYCLLLAHALSLFLSVIVIQSLIHFSMWGQTYTSYTNEYPIQQNRFSSSSVVKIFCQAAGNVMFLRIRTNSKNLILVKQHYWERRARERVKAMSQTVLNELVGVWKRVPILVWKYKINKKCFQLIR